MPSAIAHLVSGNRRDLVEPEGEPEPLGTVCEWGLQVTGIHIGTLYLMSQPKQCSFRSAEGLRTPWHGSWERNSRGLLCFFYHDSFSPPCDTRTQWVEIVPDGEGIDFKARSVRATFQFLWILDEETRAFLVHDDLSAVGS